MGIRARHSAFVRADRQCGDAAPHGWTTRFFDLAQLICDARNREFAVARRLGLVFPQRSSRARLDNLCGPRDAAHSSREPGTNGSLATARTARDARDVRGLLLRMDAVALPDLDPGVLFRELSSEPAGICPIFGWRAFRRRAWRHPGWWTDERRAATQNGQLADRAVRCDYGWVPRSLTA